ERAVALRTIILGVDGVVGRLRRLDRRGEAEPVYVHLARRQVGFPFEFVGKGMVVEAVAFGGVLLVVEGFKGDAALVPLGGGRGNVQDEAGDKDDRGPGAHENPPSTETLAEATRWRSDGRDYGRQT